MVPRFSFSTWERGHAALSIAGVGATVALDAPWPLAGALVISFGWLLVGNRGRHSARGGFGVANGITGLRLLLVLGLMLGFRAEPGVLLGLVVVVILLLDGLDGHVARRRQEATPFGAHFDVEVDAMMVMTLSCLLLLRGLAGPWVLLAGLWRYIYLGAVHVLPPPNRERTRTILARSIYVLMTSCFALALAVPAPWARLLSAVGTLSVSFSFLVSFWDRYRPGRSSGPHAS